MNERRRSSRASAHVIAVTTIVASLVMSENASAAPLSSGQIGALEIPAGDVVSSNFIGDPAAIDVLTASVGGFPTAGSSALILSTGRADQVLGTNSTFVSTNLAAAAAGADGNDMTQARLVLRPPATANCVRFDFSFLSEEYPEYVGSGFNDVFTAELNQSSFSISGSQVVAPNNFAYDAEGNAVSINTVFGMTPTPGTTMDGATPPLSAASPIERRDDGNIELIFSVQDIGDSIYDSVVFIDNLRWENTADCSRGTTVLNDADGDALRDDWETNGIDYNNDGTPELNLPAMGADPNHKDLFIEVDWMEKPETCIWFICWGGHSFAPQQAALDDVRAAFANSPMTNPDGTTGVRLHIDSGPGSVMNPVTGATWGASSQSNEVPHDSSLGTFSAGSYDWAEFDVIRNAHFNVFRRDAFHYVIYGDTYAGSGSSGISRGIPGGDLLVTDGHSSWGGGFTRTQERGTFMHELGHNLNLRHGGGDDTTNQNNPAYLSIMNYLYQLVGLPPASGLDYSRGAPFDDWAAIRFDGGSVGDLGETAPLPMFTEPDSLDPALAKSLNAFAQPGDGLADFVGPTVILANSGPASLKIDITNVSTVADTFSLAINTSLPGVATPAPVDVGPGATLRVNAVLATEGLAPATHPVAVTLSSTKAGNAISSDTGTIVVPDMADPNVRQQALDALNELSNSSPPGLDPAIEADLEGMLSTALPCTITGSGIITGTAGNDVICGSAGPDRVLGLAGNDVIRGGGGDDELFGGDGNDRLIGGPGADRLSGGAGNDQLFGGGGGLDRLAGDEGDDALTVVSGTGGDMAAGGTHIDGDVCSADPGDAVNGCDP